MILSHTPQLLFYFFKILSIIIIICLHDYLYTFLSSNIVIYIIHIYFILLNILAT